MNLEARKLNLIQQFLKIDNENIIKALEILVNKGITEEFENNLNPISLEKFNQEIDQALEDEKNNQFVSKSELIKKIQKWN